MLESEGMVLDECVSESYRGAEVRFGGVKFVLGRWGDDPVLRLSGCDILFYFCFAFVMLVHQVAKVVNRED